MNKKICEGCRRYSEKPDDPERWFCAKSVYDYPSDVLPGFSQIKRYDFVPISSLRQDPPGHCEYNVEQTLVGPDDDVPERSKLEHVYYTGAVSLTQRSAPSRPYYARAQFPDGGRVLPPTIKDTPQEDIQDIIGQIKNAMNANTTCSKTEKQKPYMMWLLDNEENWYDPMCRRQSETARDIVMRIKRISR